MLGWRWLHWGVIHLPGGIVEELMCLGGGVVVALSSPLWGFLGFATFCHCAGVYCCKQMSVNYITGHFGPIYKIRWGTPPPVDLKKTKKKIFWQGGGAKRKYHLVQWKIITKPKHKGGLGIQYLRKMNINLLCKCGGSYSMKRVYGRRLLARNTWRANACSKSLTPSMPIYKTFWYF